MKLDFLLACAVVFAASNCSVAQADLTDPVYIAGKKAYQNGDFGTAYMMLNMYRAVDTAYLDNHPDLEQQVDAAIAYCATHRSKGRSFSGTGSSPLHADGFEGDGAPNPGGFSGKGDVGSLYGLDDGTNMPAEGSTPQISPSGGLNASGWATPTIGNFAPPPPIP